MDLTIIEAVLFDMDGTLVDSDAAVERAWRTWAAEYGVDPAAVLAVAHGAPARRTVGLVRPDLNEADAAEAAARQLELQYDDLSDVVPTPGAHALLAALRLPWAIVTSADVRLAKARLGAADIVAPVLVTVEDVRVGKPGPEGYLRAAELLGVAPEHCLVVEDAAVGVTAGRAAGAQVAALKGVEGDLALPDLGTLVRLLATRDEAGPRPG